ncbi:MAG: serine hydrolase [Actinobacteria bacterium]|nr:serine hydrolase [Actinomycetota bacterium]NCG36202.1 serine hydrolase [Actinomycetota bacterium]
MTGLADRAQRRANQRDTAFAIASMTKGFVAVAVMSLVESGALALDIRL